MAVSINEFLDRLEQTGIVDDATMAEIRVEADASDGNAEKFVKSLHKSGRLTAHQAKLLWKNRGSQLAFGNYVVENELGRGGMGVVLKARHKRMQRLVAIKVLPAEMLKDADAIARFEREVVAAAQLSHPNIVGAYDADEFDGRHVLVMEYVDGRDLSSVVKKTGRLPTEQAVDCVVQAARGLEYAHGRGVVHRDIKPANLLLDADGTVKILDMGLARFSDAADVGTQAELTGTGTIMGTVDYMSPEQAMSTRDADERSDVYSLGITLYYLLTARPAYRGESLMARMMAHANHPIPDLRKERPDVPEAVQAVFAKMVAKKPEDRYQTMTEVVASLVEARSGESATTAAAAESGSGRSDKELSQFLKQIDADEFSDATDAYVATATAAGTDPESEVTIGEGTVISTGISETVKTDRNVAGGPSLPERLPSWLRDWRVLAGAGGGLLAVVLLIALSTGGGGGGGGESPPDEPGGPVVEGGLVFRGKPDRVSVPGLTIPPGDGDLCIEGYVTMHEPVGRQSLFGFPYGFSVAHHEGDGFLLFGTPKIKSKVEAEVGRKTHVAAVRHGDQFRLYVDGKQVGSAAFDGELAGGKAFDIGYYLRGIVHEVRITTVHRYDADFTPPTRHTKDADTLALYHFDEGAGDVVADASGNGHDGKITGAEWVKAGKPHVPSASPPPTKDYALEFDGVDDYVEVPSLSLDGSHPVTLEATVTIPDETKLKGIAAVIGTTSTVKEGFGLVVGTSRDGNTYYALGLNAGDGTNHSTSSEPVAIGKRVRVAAVVGSEEIRLFVDGKPTAEQGVRFQGVAGKRLPLVIGALNNLTPAHEKVVGFAGRVDEVRVSRIARYDAPYEPSERLTADAETLALYHFDEGQGDVLTDASGNGHHGKIFGAKWVRADAASATPLPDYAPLATGEWVRVFDVDPPPRDEDGIRFEDGVLELDRAAWTASRFSGRDMLLRAKVRKDEGQNASLKLRYRSSTEYVAGWLHTTTKLGLGRRVTDEDYENLTQTTLPDGSVPTDEDGFVEVVLATIGDRVEMYAGGRRVLQAVAREPGSGGLDLSAFRGRASFKDVEVMLLDPPGVGASGSALAFDGVDDYVEIPPIPVGQGPCTVEMLVHAGRQTDPYAHLVAFGNDDQHFSMGPDDGGGFSFGRLEKGKLQSTFDVDTVDGTADGPTHVAGVWDGKELALYFEGKLVSRGTKGTFPTKHRHASKSVLGAAILVEGGRERPKWFCRGTIDEVRISSTARYANDFTPPKRHEPDAQTLALYHVDEGQGDVLPDASGNGHHGKIVGAKWVRVGERGPSSTTTGLRFDGEDDYVEVPDVVPDDLDAWTLEAWTTPRSDTPDDKGAVVVSLGGSLSLVQQRRWRSKAYVGDADDPAAFTRESNELPVPGRRVHLATVLANGRLRLFVDGVLQETPLSEYDDGKTNRFDADEEPRLELKRLFDSKSLLVGGASGRTVFDGMVDEVRVSWSARYDRDFDPPDRFTKDANTVVLYHLDEGGGDVLKDSSGNGHHGKIVGAKWVRVGEGGKRGSPVGGMRSDAPGWTNLLSGGTLDAWERLGEIEWPLEEGVLSSGPQSRQTGGGALVTKAEFTDYELEFEIRVTDDGGDVHAVVDKHQDGSQVNVGTTAPIPADGTWRRVRVVERRNRLSVTVDGQPAGEHSYGGENRGRVGFRTYDVPVEYRNVRIRSTSPTAAP